MTKYSDKSSDQNSKTKPILSGPKRHHYLPRFYLEGFAKDGMVAVFDREVNEIRVQQPINPGVIGHFYTLEDSDGRKRFELEVRLSESETKASPIIKKLTEKKDINADERANLAIFVAFAAFRTPDIIDSLKISNSNMIRTTAKHIFANVETVKEDMLKKSENKMTEEELEADARGMVDFAQSNQYEVTTNHAWAVKNSIQMALSIAPILAGRNWDIVHRYHTKKSFVTTDAPVLLTTVAPRESSIWGIGFANKDALVLFPLTESCVLLIYGNNNGFQHKTSDLQQIRRINLALANHCQRFVIGREEALVSSLARQLDLANRKWEPKMQST